MHNPSGTLFKTLFLFVPYSTKLCTFNLKGKWFYSVWSKNKIFFLQKKQQQKTRFPSDLNIFRQSNKNYQGERCKIKYSLTMRVKHINVPSVINQGTNQLLNNFTRPSIFTDTRCFHVQDKGVSKQGNSKNVPYCTCSSLLVYKEMVCSIFYWT